MSLRARRPTRELRLADPHPDPQEPNLTGGWEGDGVLLRLNRAGSHLEGWMTNYGTKIVEPVAGDLEGQAFGIWDSPAYSMRLGTLHVISDDMLRLLGGPLEADLRRTSTNPGLSDMTLLAFPEGVRDPLREEQRNPLSAADRGRIVAAHSLRSMSPFIERFYALPGDSMAERTQRATIVQELDRHVGTAFRRLDRRDRAKAATWARLQLNRDQAPGRNQSLLATIQDMVPVATVLGGDPAPSLREFLGIVATGRLHHYRATIQLGMVQSSDLQTLIRQGRGGLTLRPGLGAGLFSGSLRLQELEEPEENSRVIGDWTRPVWLGQVGFGLAFALGSENSGIVSTPYHWQGRDLPGTIKMVDASAGVGNVAWGITGLFLSGSGAFPELAIDCSGETVIFGASIGVAEYIGMVGTENEAPTPYEVPRETLCEANVSLTRAIHFAFGSADVEPEARQLLRVLAAQELAVFAGGHARVVIESHADRVDTEEYNRLLTRCRAWNTSQVLQDILGPCYRPASLDRLGLGETGAARAGDKDSTENPQRRRSDVTINGRLSARLRGE